MTCIALLELDLVIRIVNGCINQLIKSLHNNQFVVTKFINFQQRGKSNLIERRFRSMAKRW